MSNVARISWWGLVATPVVVFYPTLMIWQVNIPYLDDIWLLGSFEAYQTGKASLWQFLSHQNNEHRIVFTRLVALASYYLWGHIDFRFLMLVGNLSSLLGLYYLYRIFCLNALNEWYFVPVPYLLFQLQYWENEFWGLAASTNISIVAFSIAACYHLGKGNVYGSIIFALIASFTSSNGLLLLVLGGIAWAYHRQWQVLVLWVALVVMVFAVYFSDFVFSPPAVKEQFQWAYWYNHAAYFLVLLGGAAPIYIKLTLPLGVLVAVLLGIYVLKGKYHQNPAFVLFGLFVLGTMAVLVLRRCNCGEAFYITTPLSKYRIYSVYMLIITYFVVVVLFDEYLAQYTQTMVIISALGGALFCAISYWEFVPIIKTYRASLIQNLQNFENPTYKIPIIPQEAMQDVKGYWRTAIAKGYYRPPMGLR